MNGLIFCELSIGTFCPLPSFLSTKQQPYTSNELQYVLGFEDCLYGLSLGVLVLIIQVLDLGVLDLSFGTI